MTIGADARLGYDSALGIADESTYGTANTSAALGGFIKFNSEGLKENITEVLIPTINTTRAYIDRFQANVEVSGPVEYPLHHTDGLKFIKHVMGGTITTATNGVNLSYTHNIIPDDNLTPIANIVTATSLTIAVRRGSDQNRQYAGIKVNQMTISGKIGQTVQCTVDLIGQKSATIATISANSPTFTAGLPFTFKDVHFYEAASIGALTTTSGEQMITGFDLVVNNNIAAGDEVRRLGTNTVALLPPGGMKDITLNVMQRNDTTTALNNFLNGTPSAILIVMDNGVTIGAAGSSTYSMRIELPKCYYNENESNVGGAGILTKTIPLRCISDSTTGNDITIRITNNSVTI